MILKIGEKIKILRTQQDITQEKLAAYLNISYQAISKWENGTALPDITLVPKVANFFGVSTDELLGMREAEETKELSGYEKIYQENNRLGKMFDNILLSRQVLERYPRNFQWMLHLADPLTRYNDTEEHQKYSIEHGFRKEAIRICERIIEDCTVDSIRHGAIQILCYEYARIGKKEPALKLAHEMPAIDLCRESLLAHIYSGEEKIKQCQNNLISMIDLCVNIVWTLYASDLMGEELTVHEKIKFIESANTLLKAVFPDDENSLFYNCRFSDNYVRLASLYCEVKDPENAMNYLFLAEKAAAAYDECLDSGEQRYQSIFANRCTFNPRCINKNWEGTQRQLLSRNIKEQAFDFLRDRDDFKELTRRVNK